MSLDESRAKASARADLRACLPLPVKTVTREPIDDVAIERMWRGIQERRGGGAASARGRGVALRALAATAVIAVIAFFVVRLRNAPYESGPLHVAGGTPVAVLVAPENGGTRAFALSDGSRLELAKGATFVARENSGAVFDGALRDGVATFDVRPGGPRRWSIDCGPAKVEVIGTRFEIDASRERVRVRVERGHVRVTGPAGTTDLVAGESIEVGAPTPNPSPNPSPTPNPTPDPTPTPTPTPTPIPIPTPIPTVSWQALARKGDYSRAYDTLGAPGIAKATPRASVDELFELADVARLSGHAGDAVAPLSRIVAEQPSDARSGLAAFTLGKIQLDALVQPAAAADSFARAIALGLPAGNVEDAYARLVEARARSGDRAGAEEAANRYTRAFPSGTRTATMRRWIGRVDEE